MLAAFPFTTQDTYTWLITGGILVIGLLIYGFRDVVRFSMTRANAISSVCFAESIRRRVLWITPLTMVGVILVSQLQHPIDEQDAIRQTIKFSLFAAGLVVTVTAIILACSNLPKEIDTRVIYTIVTKPTTRLEIVVGKVLGFAKVSLTILTLMGVFSLCYLHLRAWNLRRSIAQRLDAGAIDQLSRPTYEYWRSQGLLSSRSFEQAQDLQVFGRRPTDGDNKFWFFGNGEGEMLVPFKVTPEQLVPNGGGQPGEQGLVVLLHIGYQRIGNDRQVGLATPLLPTTAPVAPPKNAALAVSFLDQNLESIVDIGNINLGKPIVIDDPTGDVGIPVFIAPPSIPALLQNSTFYVAVDGRSPGVIYSAEIHTAGSPESNPVCLIVPPKSREFNSVFLGPTTDDSMEKNAVMAKFRSRGGLYGQQLRGGNPELSPVAQFKYRGRDPDLNADRSTVGFEMKIGIERSSEDSSQAEADLTRLELTFLNKSSGKTVGPITIFPENRRTMYFNVPQEAVKGGNFDLFVRNLSHGHFAGLLQESISLVAGTDSFDLNLIKSLLILWMLSTLVVVIAIFCSTFLSWPIAIMLTVVILLGHWCVMQLGGALAPGIGNQVATDLFGAGSTASNAKVVSSTVEAMSRILNTFGAVLPDITQFSAIDDIERGVTITWSHLASPLIVLLMFGLPTVTLSYVLLRNKEVAP